MATRGRPRLPDEERREKVLQIRLTDEELRLLRDAASRHETTVARWARDILVRAASGG